MQSPWLSFVPAYLAHDLARHPDQNPVGVEQRFDAVALFADLSGFTRMSETLGKLGNAGTEELTRIINSYFDPMIALIESYGGMVCKFGGDAVTILFPMAADGGSGAARRALQCALDMQAGMIRYQDIPTSVGVSFSLGMKAGLAMGPVYCVTVGDPAVRLEYVVAGEVLDLCADAEHHAVSGEVVAHRPLVEKAGDAIIGEDRHDFCLVTALQQRAPTDPLQLPTAAIALDQGGVYEAFLHPAIARRVARSQTGFVNEHRKVTVLFVRFDGFDYEYDAAIGDKLQRYLGQVIAIIHRYGGYLNKVDTGDKGSKYIALFGAPVAHEDDEERGLRCALELRQLEGVSARIGVNSGFVYCGLIGSALRQEYTVMGDAVNLSARLMQAAQPGQIVTSDGTRKQVKAALGWDSMGTIAVKGKAEPVAVYGVNDAPSDRIFRAHQSTYLGEIVGRERELAHARTRLGQVRDGQGQVLSIAGEVGMGKSRLGAEIVRLAADAEFQVFIGEAQSFGTHITYLVWHNIWRGFFGIDPADDVDEQLRQLATELTTISAATGSSLLPRMPLLDVALNLPIPDNALTESLDPKLRVDLLESLLLECLRQRARHKPIMLVLEDCHWIDPLSQGLLDFIGRNLSDLPVLMVVLHRPSGDDTNPVSSLKVFPNFGELQLTNMIPVDSKRLVATRLQEVFGDETPPSLDVIERIAGASGGNPLFIEEIISYIRDQDVFHDTERLKTLDFPVNLNHLIVSRIDRLPEDEKTTLKVSSVIGQTFPANWVWESYPQSGQPDEVRHQLLNLNRRDLMGENAVEPEPEYYFKHIAVREVAYESLTYAVREGLHEGIGQFIERSYEAIASEYVDVLAYHYGRSRNADKQRVYFRLAGDSARAAYANAAALDYYGRLIPLLPGVDGIEMRLALGEIRQLIGNWPEAETVFREALALATEAADERALAECWDRLGSLFYDTGAYTESPVWLKQAEATFERLNDLDGLNRVLHHLSLVYLRLGDYASALGCSERQLKIADQLGDRRSVVEASMNRAWMYADQGDLDTALSNLRSALDIARDMDYRRGIIHASNDLMGVYLAQGQVVQALECCQPALTYATEWGYRLLAGTIVQNVGEIYRLVGNNDQALACYAQGLDNFVELGYSLGIMVSVGNIARVYRAQALYEKSEALSTLAVRVGRQLDTPYLLCEYLYHHGRLLNLEGKVAEALPFNTESLKYAEQVGHREFQFLARALDVKLRLGLKQITPQQAAAEFEALRADWTDPAEQARLHYELWLLDSTRRDSQQAAADAYRDLYAQVPQITYRTFYHELTGEYLPLPTELPEPPIPPSSKGALNLDALLAKTTRLIETTYP